MYQIRELVAILERDKKNFNVLPQHSDSYVKHLTEDTSDWLVIVSIALSFEGEDRTEPDPLEFNSIFALSKTIERRFISALESVYEALKGSLVHIVEREANYLEKHINDILWSLSQDRDYFERHMYYIGLMAQEVTEVVHYISISQYKGNDSDDEEIAQYLHFPERFIHALKITLVATAFEILNDADYQKEEVYKMDTWDVSIMFSLFGVYRYAMTEAEKLGRVLVEKALRYRSEDWNDNPFECLLHYTDLHDRLLKRHDFYHHAIDDMLNRLDPKEVSSILMNVFGKVRDSRGATFLHVLARKNCFAFCQIFQHCEELWTVKDIDGNCALPILLSRGDSWYNGIVYAAIPTYAQYEDEITHIDLFFDILSKNASYFEQLKNHQM